MTEQLVLSKPELQIVVSLLHNPIPIVDGKVGTQVLLEINPTIPDRDSQPLDIVLVADCSGSMGQAASRKTHVSKIHAVLQALTNLLAKMSPKDNIRVIGFSDNAFDVLPWTNVGRCDIEEVKNILEKELWARDSTHFKEALELALKSDLGAHGLPVVVLLTDGNSSAPAIDGPFMVAFADKLRAMKAPLILYGTGADYNLNLLSQIAIRAGNGSLLYHVLSVEDLEGHLMGEMAFRHGHCLENVGISVFNALAKFTDVYKFVPQEKQLSERDPAAQTHDDGGSFLSPLGVGFESACGAIDHLRGQKFLFHIETEEAKFQADSLFNITITGNKPDERPFEYTVRVPAVCTTEAATNPPNADVDLYVQMVAASKAVQVGDYEEATRIYTQVGQHDIAATLNLMSLRGEGDAETSRGTCSFAGSVVTEMISRRLAEQAQGENKS